ncbi:MAG: formimidoylglutamase [Cyclobacteriaceae bacterium]|nr:formimidoylglutamase [Cyclobacteriaceae bacterium]
MYQAPDMSRWTGRVDQPRSTNTQRWHTVMQPLDLSDDVPPARSGTTCYALLGFCCDEGVRRNLGRTGAREGPAAVRKALCNLAFHWDDVLLYDAGDVICAGQKMEAAQAMLGGKVHQLLTAGYRPLVIGGGHEIAYGTFLGINPFVMARSHSLGIINVDAHFDLRQYEGEGNSGTPFLQISEALKKQNAPFHYLVLGIEESANHVALFNTARELEAVWKSRREPASARRAAIDEFVSRVDSVYLSLDLDVINQAYAPGVSAPAPFGWTPAEVLEIVHQVISTGKVVCMDIAELNPAFDIDNHTARLAAGILYESLGNWKRT